MKITKQTAYFLKLTDEEARYISLALHVAQMAVSGQWPIGTDIRYRDRLPDWARLEEAIDAARDE